MSLPLPMTATMDGTEVVIVSATDYKRMLDGTPAPSAPIAIPSPGWPVDRILEWMRTRRGQGSPVLFDQEVSRFIVENCTNMRQTELMQAGLDRFGADRMPSSSGLNRFVKSVRKYLEAHPEVFK